MEAHVGFFESQMTKNFRGDHMLIFSQLKGIALNFQKIQNTSGLQNFKYIICIFECQPNNM